MPKGVVLYGVGGHARSVVSLLLAAGLRVEGYFHPDGSAEERILDQVEYKGEKPGNSYAQNLVLGVGDNLERSVLYEAFDTFQQSITHPTSFVDDSSALGLSNLIFAFSYIGPEVHVGDNNIINTRATLEHEVSIGSHNHISIGASVAGRVHIGNHCFIGAGAVIKDKVKIGDHVVIGAGAVVVKDILESGTYVGNPLRKIR